MVIDHLREVGEARIVFRADVNVVAVGFPPEGGGRLKERASLCHGLVCGAPR